jgi:acetate kinase
MRVLVLNSGSSSQKSFLYEVNPRLPSVPPAPLWQGKVEWEGEAATLETRDSSGRSHKENVKSGARSEATAQLLRALNEGPKGVLRDPGKVDAVGHRIVNGGPDFSEPVRITQDVKKAIEKAAAFAPLHNRVELDGIALAEKMFGDATQVAVFDTGFHRNMPDAAAIYPGPHEWAERGIRRYGFHGINHQYCAERAAQLLGKPRERLRLVTCHLGNGCSLAAISSGHSVDTTMGFTPLEGLMMGTRSGSVDPGILTYLMREMKLTSQQLDDLLNKKSGLLGISGISSDMREIVSAVKSGNARAKLAFGMFVHRLQSGIGAMAASLGGIDALVFTAGIGENSPEVRSAACENLGFLGIELDSGKNQSSGDDRLISNKKSSVSVLVIAAQEDWAIAKACWQLLSR